MPHSPHWLYPTLDRWTLILKKLYFRGRVWSSWWRCVLIIYNEMKRPWWACRNHIEKTENGGKGAEWCVAVSEWGKPHSTCSQRGGLHPWRRKLNDAHFKGRPPPPPTEARTLWCFIRVVLHYQRRVTKNETVFPHVKQEKKELKLPVS